MSTQDISPAADHMSQTENPSASPRKPEILAPAGDAPSFLAALAAGADAAVLDVLNDLKDVTPAATNARISATHSPENGAEKTEKSERELHYDVKIGRAHV